MTSRGMAALLAALPAAALAYSSGAPGYSQQGCSGCHGGGGTPTVSFGGPSSVSQGSTTQFTFTVSGGSGGCAGLDISASGATLQAGGPSEKISQTEVVNSSPANMSGTSVTYTFNAVAGNGSSMTFYGAGLSGCGRSSSGDAETTMTVTLSAGAQPPTVATPASAGQSTVSGTSTTLSVLGADSAGESTLTYTWSSSPGGPTFSANGTNAAKNTTVTFHTAGSYTLTATIADSGNRTVTSSTPVNVTETVSALSVRPANPTLSWSGSMSFAPLATDQFGVSMAAPSVNWTATGDGSVGTNGAFTAGNSNGSATVTATAGGISGSTTVTVSSAGSQPPTVATPAAANPTTVTSTTAALSVLGADATGGEPGLTYTWSASPTTAIFSPNGTNAAKDSTVTFTAVGSYTLTAAVANANGQEVSSAVSVVVSATPSGLTLNAPVLSLATDATEVITAALQDQFGQAISGGGNVSWTAAGDGSIGSDGTFTAGSSVGSATVTATSGSASAQTTINVISDPEAVELQVTDPLPNAVVSGDLYVHADATDGDGISQVDFQLDGVDLGSVAAAPYEIHVNTQTQPDGPHTIAVTATDEVGKTATVSVNVTFKNASAPQESGCASTQTSPEPLAILLMAVLAALAGRRARVRS
jgi:MYXO-CTERM domain-containing protein